MRDLRPVSVNDHWIEPAAIWDDSGLDAGTRPAYVPVGRGRGQGLRIGDDVMVLLSLGIMAGADEIAARAIPYEDVPPAAHEPQARLAAMDRDGVDAQTIFPHMIGFAGERLSHLGPVGWKRAARAYNEFLVTEFCAADPERLVPMAILPYGAPDDALEELGRVAAAGARGVSLPIAPWTVGLPSFYSGEWDPVLAAVSRAGLPVFFHIDGRHPACSDDTPMGARMATMNFEALEAAVDLAYSGVLAAHPELRVVFVEAGAAWLPYAEERSDAFWGPRRRGLGGARTPVDQPPSAYLRRQVSASFIDDPVAVTMVERIGVERMLWQTDFPHSDSLWPNSLEQTLARMEGLDEATVFALLEANGRALLGLPRRSAVPTPP